ncbi:Hypothetical protein A7982_00087 [Minicystis rosea]|nr:Hypothetical protein A7982_00087 [Minicystis rosea]
MSVEHVDDRLGRVDASVRLGSPCIHDLVDQLMRSVREEDGGARRAAAIRRGGKHHDAMTTDVDAS